MGLREQAEADLRSILEDRDRGFGWDVVVVDPHETTGALVGFSTDIGLSIDPETGMAVSGRRASVTLRIASLAAAGLGVPEGISDQSSKPWRVTFDDIGGSSHTFKVTEALPDRAIGAVVCFLEVYRTS